MFKGHYQPRVPADLGYYDLRMEETRQEQAQLAASAGIEGFMYWHYWFGKGKTLLERPFKEVLRSGNPDYPFCLGWANHTWKSSTWDAKRGINTPVVLREQTYREEEYEEHFCDVLPAFRDDRYIKVDGKPLFMVYDPLAEFDVRNFLMNWRLCAEKYMGGGIFMVGFSSGMQPDEPRRILEMGFDAVATGNNLRAESKVRGTVGYLLRKAVNRFLFGAVLDKYRYSDIIDNYFTDTEREENVYPVVIPGWDRSPRAGRKATIYTGSTPELFGKHVGQAVDLVADKSSDEHKIIFLRSWNEWAEGNYVEPDLRFGHGYLDALKEKVIG